MYFVANGNIYLAPDIHSIVASRVVSEPKHQYVLLPFLNILAQYHTSATDGCKYLE